VCVETLKRDWSSTLKLRDVLVTISCLLIQPNPASALNEAAGKLANEDWDGFCRRAKLMTDIHAVVPGNIANEVKAAQMRGEDVPLEAGPVQDEKKIQAMVKGKERVKATPSQSKVRLPAVEDEENLRRRGQTQDPESDPESDWIPGPDKTPKTAARRDNIFGIKGLDDAMQLDSPPKRIYPTNLAAGPKENEDQNDPTDPFIIVLSKRTTTSTTHSSDLRLPAPSTSHLPQTTPDLLKFSHTNPFSAIQPNNQTHPLLKEFSYSWEDSEILHDTGLLKDSMSLEGVGRLEVRKRVASEEFEKKKRWEMKRFRKAGCDLGRYNRGDFGPRVGIGRL
jgi:ubiquitin-conjugating enzyme E2 S